MACSGQCNSGFPLAATGLQDIAYIIPKQWGHRVNHLVQSKGPKAMYTRWRRGSPSGGWWLRSPQTMNEELTRRNCY
ncbi:hypothetical protein N7528_002411 [Penicillium herquei]|nr:hypothetical protein N7528_002411 [Penicillium herquei]